MLTSGTQDSDDEEPTKQALSDEEEQIVVTRPEDERDPEADAEFDRELAKLMSESAESRKFERKPVFDVPLPMRRARDATANAEDSGNEAPAPVMPSNTVKFSLLSKRGNRTQTRSIDLPSDSTFAVAMRNKQQADKEEQQRIKSLVLNYNEARDDGEDTGDTPISFALQPNTNKKRTETSKVLEKTPNPYAQPRLDKAGQNRSNQRARKLQLSDVNWYDSSSPSSRPSRSGSGVASSLRMVAVSQRAAAPKRQTST
jgi:regulator of nonsense transcripts 2